MEHLESNVKVYCSGNYGLFKLIDGNRELNENKIKRIMAAIAKGVDILKECPVIVKENGNRLDIIDGQHRFYISKKLARPIHYVVKREEKSGTDLLEIATINANSESWDRKDYLNCFIEKGNQNYKALRAFCDMYTLPITTGMGLLANGYSPDSTSSHNYFVQGLFKVRYEREAKQIMDTALLFKSFKFYKNRMFLQAIARLIEHGTCDFTRLMEKYEKDPTRLVKQATYKDYLALLEMIYNKGAHSRETIYT